jgi:hypothetical protein
MLEIAHANRQTKLLMKLQPHESTVQSFVKKNIESGSLEVHLQ